jgi:hypothetical protein
MCHDILTVLKCEIRNYCFICPLDRNILFQCVRRTQQRERNVVRRERLGRLDNLVDGEQRRSEGYECATQ